MLYYYLYYSSHRDKFEARLPPTGGAAALPLPGHAAAEKPFLFFQETEFSVFNPL